VQSRLELFKTQRQQDDMMKDYSEKLKAKDSKEAAKAAEQSIEAGRKVQ
jgi:hypothetical protein